MRRVAHSSFCTIYSGLVAVGFMPAFKNNQRILLEVHGRGHKAHGYVHSKRFWLILDARASLLPPVIRRVDLGVLAARGGNDLVGSPIAIAGLDHEFVTPILIKVDGRGEVGHIVIIII